MTKIVFKVLFWLAVAAYAAAFAQWNMEEVTVLGLRHQDVAFAAKAPVAYIAFGGVVVGVIIMGIAAASAWASQRAAASKDRARVNAAKKKIAERNKKIKQLQSKVSDLQEQLETATNELQRASLEAKEHAPEVESGATDLPDPFGEVEDSQ
ncbi:MAG: hypothetical protein ACLFWB_08955 [Armatimonadota bacterium]